MAVIAVIIFLGVWLLISFVTRDRSPGSEQETATTTQQAEELSTETSRVTYTIYGPVVAEEERQAIRISATAAERRIEVLSGYEEKIQKSQNFSNNQAAFDALNAALEGAGFYEFNQNNKTNEYTVCTTGQRYVYQARFSDGKDYRSWSVNCGGRLGSFQGQPNLVQTLMQAQIPNYSDFVSGVQL